MDSYAESSSAQTSRAEDAAFEGATHVAAADGPLSLDQTSSTPHQPDENRPSKNPKLDEILQLFQKQLDLQQKQLDLLRRIAGTIDEDELPTSKALGKQAEASIQAPPPGWDDLDPELVMKWRMSRGPESPDLQEIGDEFLGYCEKNSLFWFSSNNENILPLFGSDERSEGGTTMPAQNLTLAQRFRRHWQQSLGTTGINGDNWTFLANAPGTILVVKWYFYNDEGSLSKRDSLVLWYNSVKDHKVEDPFSRRGSKLGGEFINITPGMGGNRSGSLSLGVIAYALLQLIHVDPRHPASLEYIDFQSLAKFLVSYLSKWPTDSARRNWITFPRVMHAHSIRYFDITYDPVDPPTKFLLSADSIQISRETGRLTNTGAYLRERRVSLAVVGEGLNPFPCFTILFLRDDSTILNGPKGPIMGGHFASMHMYINIIICAIDNSYDAWERVLTALDTELTITITDLFDRDGAALNQLMFDDNPFPKSKLYFNMLQLSRLFIGCIEETVREVHLAHAWFMGSWDFTTREEDGDLKKDLDNLSIEWMRLIGSQEPKLQALLGRLRRKKDEIESLRDGLFNATSVRESSRSTELAAISMRQNQYIFVFTVATVVFLPLGFVTSVFGMHLFDTTDPGVIAARPRFYITIFVLSLGTYAVAGLAYWLVRNRKQDGPDGPKVKEPPKPSNSKNSATSQPVFNSNGKEATSRTSKITTDATRSLWGQLAPLRWRKNHSAQKTTENIPV